MKVWVLVSRNFEDADVCVRTFTSDFLAFLSMQAEIEEVAADHGIDGDFTDCCGECHDGNTVGWGELEVGNGYIWSIHETEVEA